jgi:hypothetical protein
MLTYDVYWSDDVCVNFRDNYYSIKAKKDLNVGYLVNIEHVIWSDDKNVLLNGIAQDSKLYEMLYPRISGKKFEEMITQKLNDNVFKFEQNYVIGNTISKFNHSCLCNCQLAYVDSVNNDRFYGAYTIKKIKKGEELTFNYVNVNNKKRHDEMKDQIKFKCDCTEESILSLAKSVKVQTNLCSYFVERDNKFITSMTDEYLETLHGMVISKDQEKLKTKIRNIKNGKQKLCYV